MSQQQPNRLTRGEFLLAATGTVAAATATSLAGFPAPAGAKTSSPAATGDGNGAAAGSLFAKLDRKIRDGMRKYGLPGVAMGMIYRGTTYIKGYGVTNVDYPLPVDGDTLFRIGSNTKAVTGTTAMRLVEKGKLDLDAKVRVGRAYLTGWTISFDYPTTSGALDTSYNDGEGFVTKLPTG
jgi:hypothetical protein